MNSPHVEFTYSEPVGVRVAKAPPARDTLHWPTRRGVPFAAVVALAALAAASASSNYRLAQTAESRNPPLGTSEAGRAVIVRMVMPQDVCPWGLKALDLLKRGGAEVEVHAVRSSDETDASKA